MKAIILAAGRGKRMGELTRTLPKLFLEVGDRTIYQHQITRLAEVCDEAIVVLGHGFEGATADDARVREHLSTTADIGVEPVVLSDWENHENAMSCLVGLECLDDEDALILCGDVLFDRRVLGRVVHRFRDQFSPDGYSAVAAFEGIQDEMTAVRWDERRVITEYGAIEGHREAGIFVLNRAHVAVAKELLARRHEEWFPVVFQTIDTKAVVIPQTGHHEINTPEHLRRTEAALPFKSQTTA